MTVSVSKLADFDYFGLTGKRVVVTGAAGIFGGWISDAFASAGAELLLSDLRIGELNASIADGRWSGAKVTVHKTDLKRVDSMLELIALTESLWGSPDIVVNNAGIYPHQCFLEVQLEEWSEILEVNLTAPFYLTQSFARNMIGHEKRGVFVNILSGASQSVSRGGVAYSVSKSALAMLTRGSALELAAHGIRVNGLAPGFASGSEVSRLSQEYVAAMVKTIPLGRQSSPDDAAHMALFLSSDRSAFITGAMIPVDGGRSAGPVTV